MPKIKNTTEPGRSLAVAAMKRRGFSPADLMMDLVEEEFLIPEDEAVLRSMLAKDFEYSPDGMRLRRSGRLRFEIIKELAGYAYAKPKMGESGTKQAVAVAIRNYAGPQVEHRGETKVVRGVGGEPRRRLADVQAEQAEVDTGDQVEVRERGF